MNRHMAQSSVESSEIRLWADRTTEKEMADDANRSERLLGASADSRTPASSGSVQSYDFTPTTLLPDDGARSRTSLLTDETGCGASERDDADSEMMGLGVDERRQIALKRVDMLVEALTHGGLQVPFKGAQAM